MRTRFFRSIIILILLVFGSCNEKKAQKFIIGFSQCTDGIWRQTMLQEMKRELSFYPNMELVYKQAGANTELQKKQVKELLDQNVDLLIVSPNEAQPLTPVVEQAFKKGTPVIILDRKIASPLYTAYVGGDNYELGKQAGEYANHILKGKGNVLEFTLLPGSSNAAERHQGFIDAIKNSPEIKLVQSINGEILKENKYDSVLQLVKNKMPDLIFAQNDFLALKSAQLFSGTLRPKIIGADGLSGKDEGIELVANKTINATLLYPTGGEEAIRTAISILNKQDFVRENNLQTTVIDSSNVRYMQLQADKLRSQQVSIERQQSMLSNLESIYNHQQTTLFFLTSLLILSLLLGGLAFYSLREKRKINKILQSQNQEILRQKEELEVMSVKANEANEAKVAFFTNISHEFRTPLTLILAPLEDILSNTKIPTLQKQNLSLIHKNVIRLLRLVNHLMDFRKIEVDKMRLSVSENDLVSFLNEIMQQYQHIASKRKIDFRLMTTERQLMVWFDMNMLDKVFFNLLYNSFKFTNENGYIHVSISKDKEDNQVVIKIEDNGLGMSENAVIHAFEIFNQGDYENQKGSGLGLALSKEIIRLHKGSISLESEKDKGTIFKIVLSLGNTHFDKNDFSKSGTGAYVFYQDEKVYTTDLHEEVLSVSEHEKTLTDKEFSILIIEDNADLRGFLKNKLSKNYQIIEAEDGTAALQQAFDTVPDLIISDIIIPGKDGMSLLSIFKNDVRTSHIPVIIVSGKAALEDQIAGLRTMADAYIPKPFNMDFLEETIKSLLSNRSKLKDHFTSELSSNLKTQSLGKIDRKFINEFGSLVEKNIDNENFAVEDICKNLGISRIQLYRKVKALFNMSVNEYILNTRLQKAKYLLQHEECSISEVAYATGFSSPAYFSTVFKSKFGVTPKGFKEK